MKTEKPKINIAIPFEFMQKGDIGYLFPKDVVFVIRGGKSLQDLDIVCFVPKTFCFYPFDMGSFIVIKKVGNGFTIKDFLFTFPEVLFAIPIPFKEFEKFESYKNGDYFDPLEVDWISPVMETFHFSKIDLATASFDVLEGLIQNYCDLADFSKYKHSAYAILDVLPQKVQEHLSTFDYDNVLIFQKGCAEELEKYKKFPDCTFKTFVLKYEELIARCVEEFLKGKEPELVEISLSQRSLSDLEVELERLTVIEDFIEAAKVRDEIASRSKQN